MAKCGRKCEVYSRVVGYYSRVEDWNAGKKEEFSERRTFDLGTSPATPCPEKSFTAEDAEGAEKRKIGQDGQDREKNND